MDNLDELLQDILEAVTVARSLKDLQGKNFATITGIVADRNDPLGLGRVKATLPSKGGKSTTDWLTRETICPQISLPVPRVGDTVQIRFEDGNPHKGTYTGATQNRRNPAKDKDSLFFQVGNVTIEVDGTTDTVRITGAKQIITEATEQTTIRSPQINLEGNVTYSGFNGGSAAVQMAASSLDITVEGDATLNNNDILTIGSVDSGGDVSVTRGY